MFRKGVSKKEFQTVRAFEIEKEHPKELRHKTPFPNAVRGRKRSVTIGVCTGYQPHVPRHVPFHLQNWKRIPPGTSTWNALSETPSPNARERPLAKFSSGFLAVWVAERHRQAQGIAGGFGTVKWGHYTRGPFAGGISRNSKITEYSLKCLFCFPHPGGFLECLESFSILWNL